MRATVEFGVRGDVHSQHICRTAKEASALASSIAHVFGYTASAAESWFKVSHGSPRRSWQSSTHFVSVTLIDDRLRYSPDVDAWRK